MHFCLATSQEVQKSGTYIAEMVGLLNFSLFVASRDAIWSTQEQMVLVADLKQMTVKAVLISFGLILSFVASTVPCACLPGSNLVGRPKRDLLPVVGIEDLPPSDKELAEQLEIWPFFVELYDKQKELSRERKTLLRQKIRETILESYFDAASVQAEADRELGSLEALRETLLARRDRSIELNNASNFIASGTLGTVGAVLGFSSTAAPFPGNLNQMLSGVVNAGMSTYALKQSAGGKTRGEGNPTVIAELFGRPTDDRTTYPESVWRFMHGSSPDHPEKTRVEILEEHWIMRNHLERHGSRREQLKLDLVSGVAGPRKYMTLDDLSDQISMISDISAVALLMTHHLRDLLRMIDSDVIEPTPQ